MRATGCNRGLVGEGEFALEPRGGGTGGGLLVATFKSDDDAVPRRILLLGFCSSVIDDERGRGLGGTGARRSCPPDSLFAVREVVELTANCSNRERRSLTATGCVSSIPGSGMSCILKAVSLAREVLK